MNTIHASGFMILGALMSFGSGAVVAGMESMATGAMVGSGTWWLLVMGLINVSVGSGWLVKRAGLHVARQVSGILERRATTQSGAMVGDWQRSES